MSVCLSSYLLVSSCSYFSTFPMNLRKKRGEEKWKKKKLKKKKNLGKLQDHHQVRNICERESISAQHHPPPSTILPPPSVLQTLQALITWPWEDLGRLLDPAAQIINKINDPLSPALSNLPNYKKYLPKLLSTCSM